MKKIIVLLFLLLSVALVSCSFDEDDDYYDDSGIPLANDNTFKYNGSKYHKYELTNYGFLVYDEQLNRNQLIRIQDGENGFYPYPLKDDKDDKILYYYPIVDVFGLCSAYSWIWIKEGCSLPLENGLITKIDFKTNKDQNQIMTFEKITFSDVFKRVDNVRFVWEEEQSDDSLHVDAYNGYVFITFYSEDYSCEFQVMTKVYQDEQKHNYIHLITKLDDEDIYSNWYQIED